MNENLSLHTPYITFKVPAVYNVSVHTLERVQKCDNYFAIHDHFPG